MEDTDVAYSDDEEDLDACAVVHDDALVVHEACIHDALVGGSPDGAYDQVAVRIHRMGDALGGDDPAVELQENGHNSVGHNPCTSTVHFHFRALHENTLRDGEKHNGYFRLVDWGILLRVVSSCLG